MTSTITEMEWWSKNPKQVYSLKIISRLWKRLYLESLIPTSWSNLKHITVDAESTINCFPPSIETIYAPNSIVTFSDENGLVFDFHPKLRNLTCRTLMSPTSPQICDELRNLQCDSIKGRVIGPNLRKAKIMSPMPWTLVPITDGPQMRVLETLVGSLDLNKYSSLKTLILHTEGTPSHLSTFSSSPDEIIQFRGKRYKLSLFSYGPVKINLKTMKSSGCLVSLIR